MTGDVGVELGRTRGASPPGAGTAGVGNGQGGSLAGTGLSPTSQDRLRPVGALRRHVRTALTLAR